MTIEGTLIVRGDPNRRAAQARADRRLQAEARWNDPEVQRIEAERRAMYEEGRRAAKLDGLKNDITKLRAELDRDDKVRVGKESQLRAFLLTLAEMEGRAFPAPIVAEAEYPQAEPVEVDEAPRGRGRSRKATP